VLPLLAEALEARHLDAGRLAGVAAGRCVNGAVSAAAVLVLALWLSSALEQRLLAGVGRGRRGAAACARWRPTLTRALLMFVGVLLALSAAGIPLGALGVLGGAIGRGHRLRPAEAGGQLRQRLRHPGRAQPAHRGDLVKVDGFEGRITDIHTRYTVIRALNGRESIVPNELLIAQRVENAWLADTAADAADHRDRWPCGTDRGGAVAGAGAGRARRCRAWWRNAGPSVQLSGLRRRRAGADDPVLDCDPRNGQGNVRSEVNCAILAALKARSVEIPYPQRVVRQA
jgi:hypothetical protein